MLVFKYLLRVFKYLTIVFDNHPVKKICNVINYCAHIRPTWLYGIFWQLTTRGWNPNECKFINIQYL